MRKNVLLLNLPCYSSLKDFVDNAYSYNPSLGLLSITEYLTMYGFNVTVLDFNYTEINYYELSNIIEEKEIGVVGFTSYTENLNIMFKVMRAVKKVNEDIKVIAGGPHATLKPKEIIKSRYVDYVITKDGESTFLELMMYLEMGEELISLKDIPGIVYKENKTQIHNVDRGVIRDLDLLPIINRERVDINRYDDIVSMYTSKGCPAKCIYCSASFISGSKYRTRNIKNVFLECQLIYNQVNSSTDKLFFIDDTFTVNTKRVREFCELYNKYNLKMLWSCESRVDVMTDELVDVIASTGCFSIQFGVESGNQEVLNKIRKNITIEHLIHIIDYLKKYKIGIFTSFILGHYCDTEETMMETINLTRKLVEINNNVEFGVSINTPFPGTWQYDNSEEIGLEIVDKDYSKYNLITPVIRTSNFEAERLNELLDIANSFGKVKVS